MSPLIWLAAGAFAIGTETFVIAGILPEIASSLDLAVGTAGLLVTAFALTYAVSSPILSTVLGDAGRKRLLLASMGTLVLANFLAAVSQTFTTLLLARILMGVCAGLFMPTANAAAVMLSPPERRGRALALVSGGLTVAMTIGVPLGSVIATLGNWRLPFLLVAALGAISFVGIAFGLPPAIPAVKTTMAQRFAIARRPGIPRALLMTYLWSGGMFTIFTYLAVFLDEHAGISGYALAASFVLFGAFGAVGNALGGRLADRLGSLRALRGALAVLAAAMAFLGGVAWLVPPAFATIPVLVGIAVWSVSGWCTNAPQASRLVGYASDAPAVALSLNASAMYLGTASGALLGSLILSLGASWQLGLAAALCQLMALATLSTGVAERSVRAAAGQSAE